MDSDRDTAFQRLCEEQGVDRPDLMKRFGVSENTVRRWERGRGMSVARLKELADFFGVTTDEVLGRKTEVAA